MNGERHGLLRLSGLPPCERHVFRYLDGCADNGTGQILPQFAWKASLARIAENTGAHPSSVKKALAHLERHGYIGRKRNRGGRGHTTAYVLLPGEPEVCQCGKQARGLVTPMTGAERQRRYRQRKKAAVTASAPVRALRYEAPVKQAAVTQRTARSTAGLHRETQRESGVIAQAAEKQARGSVTALPQCIAPDCPKPARRACSTCWEHARKYEPGWEDPFIQAGRLTG